MRLTNICEILKVQKELHVSGDLVLSHRPDEHIRVRGAAIWVVFEPLLSCVIAFKTNPARSFFLPHAHDAEVKSGS